MKIGDKVRLRDPDSFVAELRNKCKDGRVGEIVHYLWTSNRFIVKFAAIGRKKEFIMPHVNPNALELVTDPPHGKEGV